MKIASSNNKENLLKLINEYYYTTNCIINENNEVYNTKLNKLLGNVIFKHGKYIFNNLY